MNGWSEGLSSITRFYDIFRTGRHSVTFVIYSADMQHQFNIVQASFEDIPELSVLVNSAYRGDSSRKGWTTEADLLEGLRTNEADLRQHMEEPGAVILKCVNNAGKICGSVYLQPKSKRLYLGMLTVDPVQQGSGIGKLLLKAAEQHAAKNGFGSIVMTVISVRTELLDWYKRHGYKETGQRKPFPTDNPAFGMPLQPLEMLVLEKTI